ncbi:ABC transporter ATP-binding protein [Desulfobaculum sp. SPO524]|uniref:ABC transporter ATP-binding protein n=1 Tax=Desulfobaculum sp. SPO524 TaxID=3378071 RepID=UPI0038524277
MQPIITCENLQKSFGEQAVLRGLDLAVKPDAVSVIIGRSGGGKSVLLKHLIGLMRPDSGRVVVDGQDITAFSEKDLVPVRKKFGLLFQEAALFDSMTVEENVAFPLMEHTSLSRSDIRDIVHDKLAAVGLSGAGAKMPAELSGGMRKRVGLARAVALDPKIVLFDEPTSGLDPVMSAAINDLILRTQSEFGATCVVISHDIQATMAIADDIFMLYDGRIIASGTPQDIQNADDPVVQQFIQGRADGPIGLT